MSGFTLVELMIAMLLGLVVIAGVTSVFLAGQQSFRTNDALAEVQDGSRVAFELMARDIREAGLTGCNSANNRVTNVLSNSPGNSGPQAWWADWSNAVHGYDDASTDPAFTGITGAGAPVAGTNSLELLSAGEMSVTIANDVPGSNFKLNQSTTQLTGGDIIVACSPDHAAILQISGYNNSNVTVGYNTGSTNKPGNCSSNLGYPNDACTGNSPDYTFPPNSKIAKLTGVDWYIGTNPAGGTSLYRVSLQNSGGNMTTQTQEMVRNVTGMTVTYLNPGLGGALGASFQKASVITSNNGWPGVTAVNVALTIASTFQRASVDNKALSRNYAFTTTVRNRVN
jgi:type IV pilus assembly protein PilW